MQKAGRPVGGPARPASTTAGAPSATTSGSNVNVFDPIAVARSDPYFKRNHMGKVTCTLCNIYCNDENAFIKHSAGKTHTLQLENMDRQRRKRMRLEEEERLDAEKAAAAAKEKATKELLSSSAPASAGALVGKGGVQMVVGRFGVPLYAFRTEHREVDPAATTTTAAAASGETPGQSQETAPAAPVPQHGRRKKGRRRGDHHRTTLQTKVWLDFTFNKAEEGTRPLHRWVSAREQRMETPPDDYFVYLLVACSGYTTIALKFPAKLRRSQQGDALDEKGESVYHCAWDPLQKAYSLYFVLRRQG